MKHAETLSCMHYTIANTSVTPARKHSQRQQTSLCQVTQARNHGRWAAMYRVGSAQPELLQLSQRYHYVNSKRKKPHLISTCGCIGLVEQHKQETGALHLLQNFVLQAELGCGQVVVKMLCQDDVAAGSVLLTRAFPDSFSFQNIKVYFREMLRAPPDGVLLVARLQPKDQSCLRPDATTRLVGTVALSFNTSTRDAFKGLQPPDSAVYLANMAVDASFRRQHIAQTMLRACELLSGSMGFRDIYLHANCGDEPALKLYSGIGYREVNRDSPIVKFKGVQPKVLMCKAVC